jgi:glycosyltransferase involved in cell wall biosynthesis
LKILFLNPVARLGGAERSLLDLMWSLIRHSPEHELELLAFEDGPLLDEARQLGVKGTAISLPAAAASLGDWHLGTHTAGQFARVLPAVPALRGFLRKVQVHVLAARPDVLHSNGLKSHLVGAWVRPRNVPLFWHIRDFISHRRIMRSALSWMQADGIGAIAISESVAADARRVLRRTPVVRVLNGVRTAEFTLPETQAADLDGLSNLTPSPPSTVRIGLLATYARWKGHEVLLAAASRMRDLPARFYVVGGALYSTTGSQVTTAALTTQIRQLGLSACVGLLPFQDDVRPVLQALDIVVNASTQAEPFGRSIAEGMAAGRAVVASAAGGALEQIVDGESGMLVPPGDPAALASALSTLIRDPDRRRALGKAAMRRARGALDAERLGGEVMEAYRRQMG